MKLSILIKALNEEALIANCLEAAVKEAQELDGEIILVDSLSTDKTVEIAKHFPIRIVQFSNKSDCGCGSAIQLGYQFALGDYIYLLDADMVLQPSFLRNALNYLESHPDVAGVAGKTIDTSVMTLADKRRLNAANKLHDVLEVAELGGGGLYRRCAIESVGYIAHRWLPACEEAELGARLRARGWRLIKFPQVAVVHTGHLESNSQMLLRLWKNRRMHAYGMYFRTAFRRSWWWLSICQIWIIFVAPILHFTAIIFAILMANSNFSSIIETFIFIEFLLWVGVVVILKVRRKNISDAILSVCEWNFYGLAAILGVLRSIPDPMIPIDGKELTKLNNSRQEL